MVDADSLYTCEFHPVKQNYDSSASRVVQPLSRSGRAVRYYFVDFGISTIIDEEEDETTVWGQDGRDQSVPERASLLPYDPLPVDVYLIGNVLRTQFYEVCDFFSLNSRD